MWGITLHAEIAGSSPRGRRNLEICAPLGSQWLPCFSTWPWLLVWPIVKRVEVVWQWTTGRFLFVYIGYWDILAEMQPVPHHLRLSTSRCLSLVFHCFLGIVIIPVIKLIVFGKLSDSKTQSTPLMWQGSRSSRRQQSMCDTRPQCLLKMIQVEVFELIHFLGIFKLVHSLGIWIDCLVSYFEF